MATFDTVAFRDELSEEAMDEDSMSEDVAHTDLGSVFGDNFEGMGRDQTQESDHITVHHTLDEINLHHSVRIARNLKASRPLPPSDESKTFKRAPFIITDDMLDEPEAQLREVSRASAVS
jgi:hypothetical protein